MSRPPAPFANLFRQVAGWTSLLLASSLSSVVRTFSRNFHLDQFVIIEHERVDDMGDTYV
jgi:hypothetical protein